MVFSAEQIQANVLFSAAMRKHLDGDWAVAEALYRQIILIEPKQAPARHYLGYLLQQTERLDEAVEQLMTALALDGTHDEWHFNLGITFAKQGNISAAIESFSKAISMDPNKYFYCTNLGSSFESKQAWGRAEEYYRAAIQIDPDCPDAFYLLSALCLKQERYSEARHFNYCGIIAEPAGSKPNHILGQAYYELGRVDDAISLFERWLEEDAENPVAQHLLAAYRGQQVPDQCSTEYIVQTFDTFAGSFENVLKKLQYCGPQLVRDYLSTCNIPAASMRVLDLGCGTGMVGEALALYANALDGVDLSQLMLDHATDKRLYHQLHKADISDFLLASKDQYDLITCMDTFIYIGHLEKLFSLISCNLKFGGMLLFSTEKLAQSSAMEYQLNISGRYSHHPDYLMRLLDNNGFKLAKIDDVAIRKESGYPIAGQFVCALRVE